MTRAVFRGCVLGAMAAVLIAGPAFADGRSSDQDQAVARLQALLEQQQRQIEQLEQQVALASQAQGDAQRVETMKAQIREILSEQEFRESLMPSMLQAGYDKGFFIRSSDDKFLMKINALAQFRWTHYGTRARNRYLSPRLERDDRTGFDFNRLHLTFHGHAYSPDLTYYMEFRSDADNGYNTVLNQGYVDYRCCDAFHFRGGLFRSASTRANFMDDGAIQMISRPMVDAVFGLGYNLGVRFWGQLFDKRLDWYVDVTNSFSYGENASLGRTITTDANRELDGNPALAFRLVWHALGDNPEEDFAVQSDIEMHETPALDIGFHYAFNDDYGDNPTTLIPFPRVSLLPGGFGVTNTNGLQINQWGLDAAFKYMGFSCTAEYVLRLVDVRRAWRTPFAPWWLLTGDDSTVAQHGAYVQVGYFLPIPGLENQLEAVARVGGISALANEQECTWEYSAGFNYYLQGNNVKLMTDVTKYIEVPITSSYKSMANVNDDALIWRVQLQVAF